MPQPDFYKFYLLRGISPLIADYPIHDLVIHVFDLLTCTKHILNDSTKQESIEFVMTKVLELFGEEDATTDTQTRFREFVNKHFIEDRDFFLENLKEGLTLNGKGLLCSVSLVVSFVQFLTLL